MSLTHRIGIALAIVGSAFTLTASTPRVFSPGYTYRLKISGQAVEPNGKRTDFVFLSGRATVTEKGGRLDIEEAAKERGALADKGGYLLLDQESMRIVSPKDKQVLKFSIADLDHGMSSVAANPSGTQIRVSDVVVSLDKLGPGEPLLGMPTTKYRLTQDYDLAAGDRNSSEHVVQDLWIADEKKGLANPFARLSELRVGTGSAFRELWIKTAEAEREMGRGIPLRAVTSTTSMWSRNEVTKTVSTLEVTDLTMGDVDDALLTAPADYQVTDVGQQMRSIAAQLEQAKAPDAQEVKGSAPARADSAAKTKTAAKPAAKPATTQPATDNAAAEAKQGFVKALHGMVRRP